MNIIKSITQRNNFTNISFKEKSGEYKKLLNEVVTAFNKVEYLSVVEGFRNSHLAFIRPDEVEKKRLAFKKFGLEIVLLNKEMDNTSGNYGNHALEWDGNGNFTYRSIITRPELVDEWKSIWKTREENVFLGEYLIGKGLGYPTCCGNFFTQVWMKDNCIDTTWQQALNTKYPRIQEESNVRDSWWEFTNTETNIIELDNATPVWASNLLRWAGSKLVSHLPCSFGCAESKKIALENMAVATIHGFGEEYNKLYQMLNWQMSWTAQYGVATIETPMFTISTATDVTMEKYTVIKNGHNNCVL